MSKIRDSVVRERVTEAIVRKNDVADNVEWIHKLEDEKDQLRKEIKELRKELLDAGDAGARLINEVDQLRAEVERLRNRQTDYGEGFEEGQKVAGKYEHEREQLRKENEKLLWAKEEQLQALADIINAVANETNSLNRARLILAKNRGEVDR